MASEFALIRRFFTREGNAGASLAPGLVVGVGDDAAVMQVTQQSDLVVSTDMLLEGRHFVSGADACALGHKALAVNLSDLAAMGALPRWATLALAVPVADERWLAAFAEGLFELADAHGLTLIGGDTTRGPLCIAITVIGEVPLGSALTRSGARNGDDVWVSGELGGAALALAMRDRHAAIGPDGRSRIEARLDRPSPRVELGMRLRGLATAAIDVSDGFASDLGHVLERSGVGALVHYDSLPRDPVFERIEDPALEARCVLAGGDDYELIFTAAQTGRAALEDLSRELDLPLTRVGSISAGVGLDIVDRNGRPVSAARGFDHFATP